MQWWQLRSVRYALHPTVGVDNVPDQWSFHICAYKEQRMEIVTLSGVSLTNSMFSMLLRLAEFSWESSAFTLGCRQLPTQTHLDSSLASLVKHEVLPKLGRNDRL